MTKERDLPKDSNADSEIAEEKIRRLPAGGEGWDKIKMKRKRSVGGVFPRSVDNDGELKRPMHHKLTGESSLQSGDSAHSFRSDPLSYISLNSNVACNYASCQSLCFPSLFSGLAVIRLKLIHVFL